MKDTIYREDAINAVHKNYDSILDFKSDGCTVASSFEDIINALPPAQPEYEPVTIEDFAKTMSENTFYNFMTWTCEALDLMERQGFVICKKTM